MPPFDPLAHGEDATRDQRRRNHLQSTPIIILFDGECASCHAVVRFILRRKNKSRFRCIPQQALEHSPLEELFSEHAGLSFGQSLIVWKQGVIYTRSAAVLVLCSELEFPFFLLAIAWIIPQFLRDACYNWYARRRYKLFGRASGDTCSLLGSDEDQSLVPSSWTGAPLLFPKARPVFLTAEWRNLVLVNYTVPAATLLPYLPPGLELDDWNGTILMSLVAFSFVGTSFAGIAARPYADFEEVNLRFYVKRRMGKGDSSRIRRGVVFIRELVPFRLVAAIARLRYGERYSHTPIQYHHESKQGAQTFSYTWGEAASCSIAATVMGPPESAPRGSLAHFITEHYYGYVGTPPGKVQEYEVEHPSWQHWSSADVRTTGPLEQWYPSEFATSLMQPHSVIVAVGSPVRVLRPTVLHSS
jgi:predicted DCC family thiol-disulfide oxidoreductase YuxK/uncharacterized protein YqjF (DUF2071 family)